MEATTREAAVQSYSETWAIRHLEELGYDFGDKEWDGWVRLRRGNQSGLLNLAQFDVRGAG